MLTSLNLKALASLKCNDTLNSNQLDFSFLQEYQQPFTESENMKRLLKHSIQTESAARLFSENVHNFVPERHTHDVLKELQFYLTEKRTVSPNLKTSELLILSLVEFQLSDRRSVDAKVAIKNNIVLKYRTTEMDGNTLIAFLWHMAHLYSIAEDKLEAYAYLFNLANSSFLNVGMKANVERRLKEIKTTLEQEKKPFSFFSLKFKTTEKTFKMSLNLNQKYNDMTADWGPLQGY